MANNGTIPINPSEAPWSSFPTNPEDFDADDRISFSKLDSKFLLETDDGQEFEFDDALKRWVPAVRPHIPITTTIYEGVFLAATVACGRMNLIKCHMRRRGYTVGQCVAGAAETGICRSRCG